jgi:hypothetical protein
MPSSRRDSGFSHHCNKFACSRTFLMLVAMSDKLFVFRDEELSRGLSISIHLNTVLSTEVMPLVHAPQNRELVM